MKTNNINLDQAFQKVFNSLDKIKWNNYEDTKLFSWYYAEERLYIIRSNIGVGSYYFVEASSPIDALNKI